MTDLDEMINELASIDPGAGIKVLRTLASEAPELARPIISTNLKMARDRLVDRELGQNVSDGGHNDTPGHLATVDRSRLLAMGIPGTVKNLIESGGVDAGHPALSGLGLAVDASPLIVITGPAMSGKTTAACVIAFERSGGFICVPDWADLAPWKRARPLSWPLVLDDVGHETRAGDDVGRLLKSRIDTGRQTIITTRRRLRELASYGESVANRIAYQATVINLWEG